MKKITILAGVLALALAAAFPISALADTGDIAITGDINNTIDITVPDSADFGTFTIGGNNEVTFDITVDVNADGWTLTVADNKAAAANGGKMVSGTNVLSDLLQIKGGDVTTYADVPASDGTAIKIKDGTGEMAGAGQTVTISLSQAVGWSDKAASDYTITLSFTGSVE